MFCFGSVDIACHIYSENQKYLGGGGAYDIMVLIPNACSFPLSFSLNLDVELEKLEVYCFV